MKELTKKEAYEAMFKYLELYYSQTNSDDIGSLLGSMQLLDDGTSADSGIWNEWLGIVDEILKKQ